MGSPAERLERFYKLSPWVEDPFAPGGRARYETALKSFGQLLEHEWLKELLPRGELSLLDICGGTGVGESRWRRRSRSGASRRG
jgi:hypothetical protein